MYVVLDVDWEVLEWFGLLSSKQLADCSWLMIIPSNGTSLLMTTLIASFNSEQISETNTILSPFKTIMSKYFLLGIM